MSSKVLVIDNGGFSLKAAYVPALGEQPTNPIVIPNQVGKLKNEKKYIVGEDLFNHHSSSDIKHRGPMEKGYITNFTIQKEIWDHLFKREDLKVKPQDTTLLLTEAPFDFDEIRKALYETVFEQYKFKALSLMTPATLGLYNYKSNNPASAFTTSPCQIVVDCGYSFTQVIPHFQNTKLNYAIKRFQIGGKVLTNYLKEIVSFRYWDMMHETRLLNTIKERCCYISQDFLGDIQLSQNPKESTLKVEYVLPDYTNNNFSGFIKNKPYFPKEDNCDGNIVMQTTQHTNGESNIVNNNDNDNNKDVEMNETLKNTDKSNETTTEKGNGEGEGEGEEEEEQILTLTNERFSVPELLFNPSDIGLNQAGIAESIIQAINCTNLNLHQSFYSNILLLGGTTKLPGFKQRLYKELRTMAPDNLPIKIYSPEDPILSSLYGAIKIAQQNDFHKYTVTKQEYEEFGYVLPNRKFY